MIEKLKVYIETNLESDTFVKFSKFRYGQENASCSVMLEDDNLDKKIDRTYLDEVFDNEEMFKQIEQPKKCESINSNDVNSKKVKKRMSFGLPNLSLKSIFMEDDEEEFYDLDDYIDSNKSENKFQTLLFNHIDSRELKDSDVYNKVHIDRRLFSKIRSDSEYHPSKETVILLGLALELSENEIEELLESASYSLPKNNIYDLIIRFCFVEGIYNLTEVNNLLDSYECKLFSY